MKELFVVPKTIVGGDLNAKNTSWGCRNTYVDSRALGKLVRNIRGLEVFAPAEATSIPAGRRRGKVLDILAFRMATLWEVRTQYALNSDHIQCDSEDRRRSS